MTCCSPPQRCNIFWSHLHSWHFIRLLCPRFRAWCTLAKLIHWRRRKCRYLYFISDTPHFLSPGVGRLQREQEGLFWSEDRIAEDWGAARGGRRWNGNQRGETEKKTNYQCCESACVVMWIRISLHADPDRRIKNRPEREKKKELIRSWRHNIKYKNN